MKGKKMSNLADMMYTMETDLGAEIEELIACGIIESSHDYDPDIHDSSGMNDMDDFFNDYGFGSYDSDY